MSPIKTRYMYLPLEKPAFLRYTKRSWTTFESPVARPIYALYPGGKQTHKVYMHIYKHRDVNKKCNSK